LRRTEVLTDTNQRATPAPARANLEKARNESHVPVGGGTCDEVDDDDQPDLVEDKSSDGGDDDDELEDVAFMVPKRACVDEVKGEFSTPWPDPVGPMWDRGQGHLAATPTPKRLENRVKSLTDDMSGLQAKMDVGTAVLESNWRSDLVDVNRAVQTVADESDRRFGLLEKAVRQQNTLMQANGTVLESLRSALTRLDRLEDKMTVIEDPVSDARLTAVLRELPVFRKIQQSVAKVEKVVVSVYTRGVARYQRYRVRL
jgi:hypothetical protein